MPFLLGILKLNALYHLFNLAMLARQGWRLLMVPNSLCAQVLRAKYFPNGNLLNVREQPGISYSWRSIVRGIEALKKGLIWRVGNGESINIWNDPWIPNAATRRPCTPKGRNILTRVSDLIDPVTGTWDEVLVRDIFWEMDAKLILSIPVRMEQEDFLAWHKENKGVFTVKSAYHVLKDEQDNRCIRQEGESSSAGGEEKLKWPLIWKQKYQPKVMQFVWRLAHNSLPMRRNIARRGMSIDTRCPVCFRLDEDGGHLFFKCKQVKHCWRAMQMEDVRLSLVEKASGADVVKEVMKFDEQRRAATIYLLWCWWEARNKANAGERKLSTDEVVHRAQFLAAELFMNQNENENRRQGGTHNITRWQPPPEDILKLNFDGAFLKEQRQGAWGFVIRDATGTGMGSGKLLAVFDAMSAEAAACIEALRAASMLGISRIIIESDSSNLIKALQTPLYDQAPGGLLYKEAREEIRLNFNVFSFNHCKRACNNVAHVLASRALSGEDGQSSNWTDPFPPFVTELLVRDIAEPG
jgi:ribonuclease HI